MFPLGKIAPMILQSILGLLFNPVFWLVVVLVGWQYKRIARAKKDLFGVEDEPVWQHTLLATVHGIMGGLVGSLVMVLVGISISDIGITYLWGLAVLLMLVSPRFLCFSYSGSIISVSYLLFGFPKVDVPQLMGLVAVLHMVESVLILFSGHLGATPVYVRNAQGRVVGAFNLQKFWPIPIVALFMVPLSGRVLPPEGMVQMPDWWPLIKTAYQVNPDNFFYAMLPVVAGLGYGDLAMTALPPQKSRHTAVNLFLYSLVLLTLAILASHYRYLAILPALFGALAHEYLIKLGRANEMRGEPLFVPRQDGAMVLDVLRSSVAAGLGLSSGAVIYNVNGMEVHDRFSLATALGRQGRIVEVEFYDPERCSIRRQVGQKELDEPFGVILVPDPNDSPHVQAGTKGPIFRWLKRLKGKWGK